MIISGVSKDRWQTYQRGLSVKATDPKKESKGLGKHDLSMVCDHCGSEAHVTFYEDCPTYCTVFVASGHCRNTNACPNRVCTKCNPTGHTARQCTFCQARHAKNKCPRQQRPYCAEYGHEAKRSPEKPTPTCYACGSSAHQTPRSFDCPEHR